jgi:hypothetical protein
VRRTLRGRYQAPDFYQAKGTEDDIERHELEIPGALGCYENKSMKHECLCCLHVTEYDIRISNLAMNTEYSKRILSSFD